MDAWLIDHVYKEKESPKRDNFIQLELPIFDEDVESKPEPEPKPSRGVFFIEIGGSDADEDKT